MHMQTTKPTNHIEVGAASSAIAVNPLTITSVRRDSRNDGQTSTQRNYRQGKQR